MLQNKSVSWSLESDNLLPEKLIEISIEQNEDWKSPSQKRKPRIGFSSLSKSPNLFYSNPFFPQSMITALNEVNIQPNEGIPCNTTLFSLDGTSLFKTTNWRLLGLFYKPMDPEDHNGNAYSWG